MEFASILCVEHESQEHWDKQREAAEKEGARKGARDWLDPRLLTFHWEIRQQWFLNRVAIRGSIFHSWNLQPGRNVKDNCANGRVFYGPTISLYSYFCQTKGKVFFNSTFLSALKLYPTKKKVFKRNSHRLHQRHFLKKNFSFERKLF